MKLSAAQRLPHWRLHARDPTELQCRKLCRRKGLPGSSLRRQGRISPGRCKRQSASKAANNQGRQVRQQSTPANCCKEFSNSHQQCGL